MKQKQTPRLTQFKKSQELCKQFIIRWQNPNAPVAVVAQWADLSKEDASNLAHYLRVRLAKRNPPVILMKKNKPPSTLDFDALADVARREAGQC